MLKYVPSAVIISAISATSGHAMGFCGDRDAVVEKLVGEYAESHKSSGLQSDTGLLEIWTSDVEGTWTVLLTRPDGKTCIMATGTHWLDRIPDVETAGQPA